MSEAIKVKLVNVGREGVRVLDNGSVERGVFVQDALVAAILFYAQERTIERDGYLFPSKKGGHITKQRADQIIKRAARRAGLRRGVHAHMFRHGHGWPGSGPIAVEMTLAPGDEFTVVVNADANGEVVTVGQIVLDWDASALAAVEFLDGDLIGSAPLGVRAHWASGRIPGRSQYTVWDRELPDKKPPGVLANPAPASLSRRGPQGEGRNLETVVALIFRWIPPTVLNCTEAGPDLRCLVHLLTKFTLQALMEALSGFEAATR